MTDKYAVIGHPITHSKSPQIHKLFAQQTGESLDYVAIDAPLDRFSETVERLRREGYRGCNVTVPFKFDAYKLIKQLESLAPALGICNKSAANAKAANTLTFRNNFVSGDNTDGTGLVNDIQQNLRIPLKGKRILLMGAGGAAYGVLQPLLHQHPESLAIANRTLEKADALLKLHVPCPETALSSSTYADIDRQFDVIINATSSGLTNEMPQLPPGIFAEGALAYDMMYGRETPFLKFAREQNTPLISDGLGMLVEQAAEAFYIWRGVRPRTAPVIASLR
ncbi:MAG: shikimate dehydrogenase [Gallionella sp.]